MTGCCAEVRALIDVTFHVGAGELVEVRGAPGAGKTTLLHCVSGLLAPDAGEMRWFGTCDRRRVACIISPPTSPFQAVRWQRHRLMEARAARASLIVIDLALARGDAAALLREEIAGALGCGASVLAASNGFDLGALPRRTIVLACGRIAHGRMRAHSVRRFPPRAVSSRVAEPG